MKLLSIDVGMKNLAFCLMDLNDDDNFKNKIQTWGVINLCEDEIIPCKELTKKKCVCNKTSTFHKNGKYYCKTHAKKIDSYKVPNTELRLNKLKKYKINKLKDLCSKYDIPLEKKMKKVDILNRIILDLSNNYLNFVIKIKASQYNLVEYGRNMKDKFNEVLNNEPIDCVIVENQIGPLALRMKTLQGMIMQHFIEIGVKSIKEVSSSNKLREFIGNKHTSYNERKKESIKATANILTNSNFYSEWIIFFNKHKKKDDLADCFLQAKWYIKNINKNK
jgi:hypothetical protein